MRYASTNATLRGASPPPRLRLVAVILLGHGLVVYLLLHNSANAPTDRNDDLFSQPIYLTPLTPRATQKRSDRKPLPTSRAATHFLPEQQPIPLPDAPEPDRSAPIDWGREARNAAARAIQPDASSRPFALQDETRMRPRVEVSKPRERAHRAGDIEMVGPGIERRWVNEKCFWEFGRPPPLLRGPLPQVNQMHCKLGPIEPDSHLFDEIKPRYLQKKD